MASNLRFGAVMACFAAFAACSGSDAARIQPEHPDGGGPPPEGVGEGNGGENLLDAGTKDVEEPDAAPSCDDGNPCTDDRVEDGGCTHSPLPDGAACSDGMRCTGSDRCQAGVCRGDDLTPHVAARGSLFAYGAAPNEDGNALVGAGEAIWGNHLLFAESLGTQGMGLSLVEVTSTGLARIDTRRVDGTLQWFSLPRDWSERQATFFVPLGDGRVVLVNSRRRLELFDIASGKIESRSTFPLLPNTNSMFAGVGRGSRFWTCELHAIHAWEIDGAGAIQRQSAFFPPHQCSSLALSPDGNELLIANGAGIDRLDVSKTPVEKPTYAPGRAFWRAEVNATWVVGQRLGSYGAIVDIEVYRRADLEADPNAAPTMRFASTGASAVPSNLPLGFALFEDRVAIEWSRGDGTETTSSLDVYALPGGGTPLRSFVHRRTRDRRMSFTPVALARRENLLIVPPWRTVLRDDPAQNLLTPLTGEEQAGFEVVTPLADAAPRLAALSGRRQHTVDLSNPDAPVVVGSATLPVDTSFLRWEPNGPDALTAAGRTAGALAMNKPTVASCFTRGAAGTLGLSSSMTVPGQGHVADLGRGLLQLRPANASGQFGVSWFDAPAVCNGTTLPASVDGTVNLAPPAGEARTSFAFDGERSGKKEAVLVEMRRHGDDPFASTIAWIEPTAGGTGWQVAARTERQGDPWLVVGMRKHGDAMVLTDSRRLMLFRRTGNQVALVADREPPTVGGEREELAEILRFDGELVYVATRSPSTGVLVVRARDLEVVARFQTNGIVRSMAEVGDRLVFGSANALDVADAVCPLN